LGKCCLKTAKRKKLPLFYVMRRISLIWALFPIVVMTAEVLSVYSAESAGGEPNLVIVDNDFTGPPDTLSDLRCALMFLESQGIKVLGFTVVTGDGWRDEELAHLLRLEEIAGRTDVPVVRGAEYPLVNTPEDMRAWEKQFGEPIAYKGAWDLKEERTGEPGYSPHDPNFVPSLPEGSPKTHAQSGYAPEFMIEQVHAHPHQVSIFAGGPLTDIALAIRMDPEFAGLAKQLVFMGAASPTHYPDFNVRFDPEAARIVLTAPWASITSVCDVTYEVELTPADLEKIRAVHNRVAEFVAAYSGYDVSTPAVSKHHLWDEVAASVLIDPSLVEDASWKYLDVIIDHGIKYGAVAVFNTACLNADQPRVRVVQKLDVDRFKAEFIDCMTAQSAASPTQ
jgi:inosine-uridine nucleoside N-ribohydrolase